MAVQRNENRKHFPVILPSSQSKESPFEALSRLLKKAEQINQTPFCLETLKEKSMANQLLLNQRRLHEDGLKDKKSASLVHQWIPINHAEEIKLH